MMAPQKRRLMSNTLRSIAITLASALSIVACGSRGHGETSGSEQPIAECEAFLSAYQHCLESLGPKDVAAGRIAQSRETLRAEASRSESARSDVRRKCSANLASLASSCR